ncbi:Hypothetical predicted protein [Pelobates cultripes]|uniref:Uncharacterized protein n=1 Tax=Pelobates cultripes TaxID=61616 RepID=A0AAD1S5K9_PELCU|nr:Hypothetical predicted protein [Pelobates cultripes]
MCRVAERSGAGMMEIVDLLRWRPQVSRDPRWPPERREKRLPAVPAIVSAAVKPRGREQMGECDCYPQRYEKKRGKQKNDPSVKRPTDRNVNKPHGLKLAV